MTCTADGYGPDSHLRGARRNAAHRSLDGDGRVRVKVEIVGLLLEGSRGGEYHDYRARRVKFLCMLILSFKDCPFFCRF